jgi:hypothetical protein
LYVRLYKPLLRKKKGRGEKQKKKDKKRKRGRQLREKKTQRTEGVFFFHSCTTMRSGRQAIEEKEEKKKKRETINKQGLLVGLCFIFLHIKSTEKGRRKCRNPLERE